MAKRASRTLSKPLIKSAVEGARKGVLFMTVLRAMSDYSEADIEALTGAYIEASMPFGGDGDHDTPLAAIQAQKIENAEFARNPFVSPEPLEEADPAIFAKFEGEYTTDAQEKWSANGYRPPAIARRRAAPRRPRSRRI